MLKIAFTSCFDALRDAEQTVWNKVAEQRPDALLLLGDSIYMDFFPHLGRPRDWDETQFRVEMYRRYAAQWAVPSFRRLLGQVPLVGVTWDDHDFAWNNSAGAGSTKKDKVQDWQRRISRGLQLQFRAQLEGGSADPAYPACPPLEVLKAQSDDGIEYFIDTPSPRSVRCIMTDGRTFRQTPDDDRKSNLLGEAQRVWLLDAINGAPGLSVLCTGSTLARSGESWDKFSDYEWLMSQNLPRTLVLSGDIHTNTIRCHRGDDGRELNEFTSSGAARPGLGGDVGNFGLLEIEGGTVKATLFAEHGNRRMEKVLQFPII